MRKLKNTLAYIKTMVVNNCPAACYGEGIIKLPALGSSLIRLNRKEV